MAWAGTESWVEGSSHPTRFVSSLKGLGNQTTRIPSTHVLGYDCAALRAGTVPAQASLDGREIAEVNLHFTERAARDKRSPARECGGRGEHEGGVRQDGTKSAQRDTIVAQDATGLRRFIPHDAFCVVPKGTPKSKRTRSQHSRAGLRLWRPFGLASFPLKLRARPRRFRTGWDGHGPQP